MRIKRKYPVAAIANRHVDHYKYQYSHDTGALRNRIYQRGKCRSLSMVLANLRLPLILMGLRSATLALKLALTLYIAKFCGLDVLGIHGLILGITLTFPVIARAGIFSKLNRDIVTAHPSEVAADLANYLLWTAAIYLTILPAAFLFGFVEIPLVTPGLYLAIWSITFLEHLSVDAVQLLNTMRRPGRANLLSLFQATAWTGSFIVSTTLDPTSRTIDTLIFWWAVSSGITLILAALHLTSLPWSSVQRPQRAWLKGQLSAAGYIFAAHALGLFSQYSDRYIIALLYPIHIVGVYTFYSQIAVGLYTLIIAGIHQVHQPEIIRLFKGEQHQAAELALISLLRQSVGVFTLLATLTCIASIVLIPMLDIPHLVDYMALLPLILFAWIARYANQALSIVLFATSRDRANLIRTLFSAVATVVLPFLLYSTAGIAAIPISIALVAMLMYVHLYIYEMMPECKSI